MQKYKKQSRRHAFPHRYIVVFKTVPAGGSASDHQGDTAEPKDGGTAVSSSLTMPGSAEGDGDGDDGAALPNLDLWTTNPPGRVVK